MVDSRDQENRIIESLKLQRLVRQVTAFSCKKKKKKKKKKLFVHHCDVFTDPRSGCPKTYGVHGF